jgi:hypothetical protein
MRGDLVSPPRLKNGAIPKTINDIVMKALAPDVVARYQRASDLLDDLLAARPSTGRRTPQKVARAASDDVQSIHNRLKARETPQARFCWHCRKPLHARSSRCPFCGESQ